MFRLILALVAVHAFNTAQAATLETVQKRGVLQCGVSQGLPGFSSPDAKGQWQGIDVDYCRALAAAVLGSADKVRYRPLSAKERFTALQAGEIDVLSRNTSWTLIRDASLGLDFVGVIYFDGQGFLVRKDLKVARVAELNGATICVNLGTSTELNLADYFRAHGMKYKLVAFEKSDEVVAAYDAGRCDAYTTDVSGIHAQLMKLRKPQDHIVLPDMISKEPLGPVVRQGDDQWADVARWVLYALFEGEELGVGQKNVDESLQSDNPSIKRLLGREDELGKALKLDNRWAYRILKEVGNYGEIYERHVGEGSDLKIKRGMNALWNQGGLHYPPPFR